ncbi:hypothetical protein K461DRAFT_321003 [Myriangium duriaei CBS 260.36]|uniref:Uncharacterized protein n=1 Tax=Myriangium duriaei CBS 260.36 TaxID=1168546 RepID=A0A9P4J3C4_9PEZI|nr:hypothetical protein K461DRAFT_321003 [Myriangium duriaei CBS 260.36]
MRRILSHPQRHPLRCSNPTHQWAHSLPSSSVSVIQRRPKSGDSNGSKIELYRLLFPEDSVGERQKEEQQRRLDELGLRMRQSQAQESITGMDDSDTPASKKKKRIAAAKRVLVMRGAGRNLVREDFLRIVPQAKNLEGWITARSFIQKVVQDRDLETLERRGTYYLIFKTAAATAEYQKRANRVSKLVNFHGSPSQVSERPTPPDLMFPGEDVNTLIRSYTLMPYGSTLRLYQPPNELPDWMAAIADCGGLPDIVNRPSKMPFEVAVRLPMSPISRRELEMAVARAEIERNLPWTASSYSAFKCEEWISPASPKPRPQRGIRQIMKGDRIISDSAAQRPSSGPQGLTLRRSCDIGIVASSLILGVTPPNPQ